MAITAQDGKLTSRFDGEQLQIEPWGENALRVRATCGSALQADRLWALLPRQAPKPGAVRASASAAGTEGSITNGRITARVERSGRIAFLNAKGEVILEERWRTRGMRGESFNSTHVVARELKPLTGGSYRITARFEARDDEKIYGMGQYQDGVLNLKGCMLELAQRNSQCSVPFYLSSRGYGFLWNNPAVGRVTFARNMTEWVAETTTELDYWITAGDDSSPDRGELRLRDRHGTHDAGLRHGLLAVQAPLPDPGGAAGDRSGVQEARAAPLRDRRGLLPLAAAGRLDVRFPVLAGPGRHGAGAGGHGRQAHGFHLANGGPPQRQLSGDAGEGAPGARRSRDPDHDGLHGEHRVRRPHQPRGAGVRLEPGEEELLGQGDPDLLAGRSGAGVRPLRLRQLPLPPGIGNGSGQPSTRWRTPRPSTTG